MSDYEEPIDDETKVSIAAEFMKYAPPGEFNEVYNDVAKLIANDELLRQATSEVITTFITTYTNSYCYRQSANITFNSSHQLSWASQVITRIIREVLVPLS